MVKAFMLILGILFTYQICYQKGYKKIVWFLAGILFIPHSVVLLNVPVLLPFRRVIIYALLFNTLLKKDFISRIRKMPVFASLVFLFVMCLATGVFDERLDMVQKFYRPITYFFENFFILVLCYYHINKAEDMLAVYRKIVLFLVVFSLYGISNYITRTNEYYNILNNAYGISDFANANMDNLILRFRVSSFAFHAIYYGLLLCIAVLILTFLYFHDQSRKLVPRLIAFALLLLNLILVNSRTPLLALMAGFAILFSFGLKVKSKLQLIAIGGVMIVGFVATQFNSSEIIAATFNVFKSNDSDVGGSSIDMRREQLQASLKIFSLSPITGNGYKYIGETMGFSSDETQNMADDSLHGFESYAYKLLIEQGLAGIIGNSIFFASIILFFLKASARKVSKPAAILGLSMLASFLLFILGTGDLGSFPFFMAVLGVSLRGVELYYSGDFMDEEAFT